MRIKKCGECGTPLASARIAAASGTADGWHIELLDYPILACPQGHERREAYADFNVYWHQRVTDVLGLDERRTLFRRRYVCRECRNELSPPVVRNADVQIRTRPDYEFRIRATGLMAQCGCSALTIRDQESSGFMDALVDALKGAGIARY